MATEKRLNCPMRHENGNCLPCGGFCTAVNDPICEALHNAFKHGESAECERLTLVSIEENRKFQEAQLEALREIHKKVTSTTVDAVEVVRCKDCKHWLKDVAGCTDQVGRCEFANYMVGAVGYCVYGEREDNG